MNTNINEDIILAKLYQSVIWNILGNRKAVYFYTINTKYVSFIHYIILILKNLHKLRSIPIILVHQIHLTKIGALLT